MPLPPGVTTRIYTGTIVGLDGVNAAGTLEFRQPKPIYDSANNVVVGPQKPLTATVTDGAFSIALPVSPWQYVVRIATDAIKDVYLLLVEADADPLHFADTYLTAASAELVDFYVLRATFDALAERVTDLEETGGVSVPDATTTTKGILQLAGDLAGTATAPTVPGLAAKYTKPGSGIPSSDLTAAVQALLALAGTAVQPATLATVATSGAYADLTGKPTIPDSPDDIGAQPLDSDLTTIAALAPSDNDLLQRISGAWSARTPAQVKTSLGLDQVNNTSDAAKPVSTAQQAALDGKVSLSTIDAAGDLLVGSGDNTLTRLPKGVDGQVLTVVGGALVYADPASGGLEYDPGDDILGLYGFHSASSNISSFRSEFGQNNEIWIARVLVRAGRAINKIGTFVKTAGVLGAGGTNGFALASDDGSSLLYSVDTDNLWETAGLVSVNLGGSSIPAQPTDTFYRAQLSVHGYTTAPVMLLNQGDHAVLSDHQGRARFGNASSGFQGGGGYDPLTFGTSTGGFYPLIMLG